MNKTNSEWSFEFSNSNKPAESVILASDIVDTKSASDEPKTYSVIRNGDDVCVKIK